MAVNDHGLEVLKKSGEEVTPGDPSDLYIKVANKDGSLIGGGSGGGLTDAELRASPVVVDLGDNNDVSVSGTVTVDGSGVTQPVSASSLPLPAGAATSALQTSSEALLTSLDGKDFATETTLATLLTDTQLRATPVPISGTVTANAGAGYPQLTVVNAIDSTAYDLNAAPYSVTSSISNDYILDHIQFNFSSAESRDIIVTLSDGTILWSASADTSLDIILEDINKAFNANDDFTIAITQTSGACLVNVLATIKEGDSSLGGNPTVKLETLKPNNTYSNEKGIGLAFSTSTLLTNGETYDSGILDLQNFSQVLTQVLSDVDGTIVVDFIRDSGGADILRTLTVPHTSSTDLSTFGAPAFTNYVRYRFTADEAGQSDFYFDTKFLTVPLSPQTLNLGAFISPLMTANLSRSIIVGKTSGGYYSNVAIEPVTNALQVDIPRSAFGEIEVVFPTPVIQVDFIYNVNSDMVDSIVTGSGTVTQADAMLVLQTTAATSSSAMIETKRFLKYRPGQGAHIRGTALFTTGVANSEQLFGCGDDVNGFFFGFNGASFGVMSRNNSVDTWVAQADWNGDKMDGGAIATNPTGQTLDPTKGNVYQINFQWLGFGLIEFAIEDAQTGRFVPVHSISYANANTVPSLLNPSFPILWSVENTTNNTNITLKGASACAEVEGKIEYLGPTNAIGNTKTGVTTTLTNIITIRNKSTYQSITNRTPINILKYSLSVDGNKPAEFQIVKNATLGGTPSYTDISTNTSVVDYDTAGTTVTGGRAVDFGTLAAAGSVSESGQNTTDIIILPGETLTLAVNATTATTDATVAIRWVEDF